jgi:hypothetical protein
MTTATVWGTLAPKIRRFGGASLHEHCIERVHSGYDEYGTFLMPHNGRDARKDYLDEIADALFYNEQELRENRIGRIRYWIRFFCLLIAYR